MLRKFNITSTSDVAIVQSCLKKRYGCVSMDDSASRGIRNYEYNEVSFGSVNFGICSANSLSFSRVSTDCIIMSGRLKGNKILSHGNKKFNFNSVPTFEPLGRADCFVENGSYWEVRICPVQLEKRAELSLKSIDIKSAIGHLWGKAHHENIVIQDLVFYIFNRVDRHGLPGSEEVRLFEDLVYTNFVRILCGAGYPNTAIGYKAFSKCIEFIDSNIDENINVKDLADIANCSVRTVQYMFNRLVGCSVGKFVSDRRLDQARMMLQSGDPDKNVSSVSMSVGIDSESYFAKLYFSRFGELPSKTLQRGK